MADRLAALEAAVQRAPDDVSAWQRLGEGVLRDGSLDQLFSVFNAREAMFGDGLVQFYQMLFASALKDAPGDQAILNKARQAPDTSLLTPVLLFFAGGILVHQDQTGEGFGMLTRAARMAASQPQVYKSDRDLEALLVQPIALPDPDSLQDEPSRDTLPAVDFTSVPAQPETFFAACNQVYFARYGAQFLEVFRPFGPVHFHLMDWQGHAPTSEPGVSYSFEETGGAGAHYYASARFLRAPELAARTKGRLVILDIDFAAVTDFQALLDHVEHSDVAWFRMDSVRPWVDHHAAFYHLAATENARRFALKFSQSLQLRMDRGFWGIDQAALCAMYHYARAYQPEVRLAQLRRAEGWKFEHHFAVRDTADLKWALRTGKDI